MPNLNRVLLMGNLTRDPELRYTQSGTAVASLNIATSRKWRDKKRDGELVEETEWHRVSVFGSTAEHCARYLTKGRQVHVEGRLRTRKYTDHDDVVRWSTEIVAENVQFLGAPIGGGSAERSFDDGGQGAWYGDEPQPPDPHDPAAHASPDGKRKAGKRKGGRRG